MWLVFVSIHEKIKTQEFSFELRCCKYLNDELFKNYYLYNPPHPCLLRADFVGNYEFHLRQRS